MKKIVWTGGLLLLALALAFGWWYRDAPAGVEYRSAPVSQGDLQAVVAATGAVNPVALVTVGTQVSGQIRDVLVDFNDEVQAGQLLAQIDPQTFDFRLRAAQADLEAAQAAVLTAQANALAAQAQVSRAQVDLREAQRNDARTQGLVDKQFVAQAEGERVRALASTNAEALKAVQAQVGVAQAQVKQAQATVAQRKAALAQAGIDLGRTRITSPVAGIVIKRAIERGQTVASSLQSPELFIIAKNLRDMQVEAAIDESDVGRLVVGQKATFTVDAFPGQTFSAEVRQVRKAALNVANVVTYVAVLSYANTDGRLLPGMTANVRVVTQERPDVLRVPNGALRLRIAGVDPAVKGKGLGRVYVLDAAGKPRALAVRTGISDGSLTELVDDPQAPLGADLAPGTEVLVAVKTPPAAAPKPAGVRPNF